MKLTLRSETVRTMLSVTLEKKVAETTPSSFHAQMLQKELPHAQIVVDQKLDVHEYYGNFNSPLWKYNLESPS